MQDTQSQDRIAGALSYIFFLIPILMDRKTEYTCFHMKQSFLIFVTIFVTGFIPFFGHIISVILFFHVIFLMWKAYSGEKYTIFYIYPYAERLITLLGIQSVFTSKN